MPSERTGRFFTGPEHLVSRSPLNLLQTGRRRVYALRMPLDPAFVADCLYGPGGLLIDEILAVDAERNFVSVRMPTYDDLPLTREQRAHPVRHPRHVSGGLMVHMTGMVGY